MLYDHVDLRVRNIAAVREFYDAVCFAMGLTRIEEAPGCINYQPADREIGPFFGLMTDASHRANGTRLAFCAASRDDVDRIAQAARNAGARAFEPAAPYDGSTWYYASFFEDPEGNKLEVCYREPHRV